MNYNCIYCGKENDFQLACDCKYRHMEEPMSKGFKCKRCNQEHKFTPCEHCGYGELPFTVGELDPNGVDAHSKGAKLDDGKIMMSLLLDMSEALKAVAEVGTFGAKKYTRGGWLEVPNGYNRYTDAMMRHLMAEGEYDDGEGGIGTLHDAQVAWNALARLTLKLKDRNE